VLQLTQSDPAVLDDALSRVAELCRSKDGRLALTAESAASRVMLVLGSAADGKYGDLSDARSLGRAVGAVSVMDSLLKASRESENWPRARIWDASVMQTRRQSPWPA